LRPARKGCESISSGGLEVAYVLRTGADGAERLRLLARVKWPTTQALLSRLGLREGMKCLDIGCGIGEVTMQLARWVGPRGLAVGCDREEGFIATARAEAARQGVTAEFRVADAADLGAAAMFDLAYARFLLAHLSRPDAALGQMIQCVRPGGLVVVEDIDFPGHFCYPACPAFDRYVELFGQVVKRNGGDAAFGPRLLGLFRDACLDEVGLDVVLPTFCAGEGKRVAPVTMEHIRDSLMGAGLATAGEVDQLVRELDAFAADESSILSLPRIFQAWGRRGNG